MKSYKQRLADRLDSALRSLFPEAERREFVETDEGFFCDYALDQPLRPDSFAALGQALAQTPADCAFALDRFSGAYAHGDASEEMLQRVSVLAFASREQLDAYQRRAAEAAAHDHKALGAQLGLYSSAGEIGQGLILWHPAGAMLRVQIERFGQQAHLLNDYQWVYTPHIGRASLWERSGHLDFYRDSMYSPIEIDGEAYYLKPMSCPFHIEIYNSVPRSYRELPMRLAEYATVYRYELSGTLNGLTRVRGFTQDDAHIICTEQQMESEVAGALRFSLYMLRAFGFETFEAYVSTKPEKKCIGDDAQWERATTVLKAAVRAAGLTYQIDEGGGAFYGPKIDLKLRDSLGRAWQCSTIQFDFNLPARFAMRYVGGDGRRHTPYMVHRALFGSLERFTALLIEHYNGAFPLWLSPVQMGVVPVRPEHNEYAHTIARRCKQADYRVKVDDEDTNLRSKIKAFQRQKLPLLLVVGDREQERGTVSVRS